jgi:hypothetical protein
MVMEAIKTDYQQATEEMKAAMKFFLKTVIPSVDPDVGKKQEWVRKLTLHEKFKDCWHYEMAMGLLVLDCYSDLENLTHNAKLPKSVPDTVMNGQNNKKKRKHLQDKEQQDSLQKMYYKLCMELKAIELQPGLPDRMMEWENECGTAPMIKRTRGPGDRVNVVPTQHRGGANNGDKNFQAFLQQHTSFGGIFKNVPYLSQDDTAPEVNSELPITQQATAQAAV